ncbi:MAG: hypothetical protein A2X35_04585 [Elusimicrobia bacterium GWA2_61_42]|nr:MAG: hypothetical protein A2X35_04585 [Elusimicrobia bacterium GWA2_61_42]OGR76618.1 MAG: hypothetical protein A2X38_03500 [Elusimicrobia bacterium GWC2_61_25]
MPTSGNAEALERAILETARRERDGILAGAAAEAEKIVSSAEARAREDKAARLASALAAAARRREMQLAAVPAEAGRLRADSLERLLDAIKKDALARLPAEAAAAGPAAVLAELAAQAVSRMDGDKFIVSLAPEDLAAATGLAAEIERRAGRGPLEIRLEEISNPGGGVLVRDGEGRQYWDNSFRARLERFWPELRGRLLGPGSGGGADDER